MFFSDLTLPEEKTLRENKQRIALSGFAYDILKADSSVFAGEESLASPFLCRVFLQYQGQAAASAGNTLRRTEREYRQILRDAPDSADKAHILALLLAQKKAELENTMEALTGPKEVPLQIRLNREVVEFLSSEDGQREGEFYGDRIGSYMKAVLEEYCGLAYVRREQVYFRELIQTAQSAVLAGQQLKLEMYSSPDPRRKNVRLKPLDIRQDSARQYNYLVGMLSFDGGSSWAPGSIRLTSVKRFRQLCERASLSQAERDGIETAIRSRGVQYLSSETGAETVTVRFTEQGRQLYRRILNQRPALVREHEDGSCEFQCTAFQAENYFFRFGPDAVILRPRSLADRFRDRCRAAAAAYEEGQHG